MAVEEYTPPPGTVGSVWLGSNELLLEEWQMTLQLEKARKKHFGIEADAAGLYVPGVITGFTTGTAQCRGRFNLAAGGVLPTDKEAYLGAEGEEGFLGYTPEIGWLVGFKLTDLDTGQSVNVVEGATYAFTIEITAVEFVG